MFDIGGKKFAHIADHGLAALMPYTSFKAVAPAATPLPDGTCRGIWASEDTTISFTDIDDNAVADFPLAKGRNEICAKAVTAVGTGTVWACY